MAATDEKPASNGADNWNVRGVPHDARAMAKRAARKAGKPLGEWLADVVMRAATDEIRQQEDRQLPVLAVESVVVQLAQLVEQQGQMLQEMRQAPKETVVQFSLFGKRKPKRLS